MDRLTLLWENLMSLGAKKLSALGLTFVLVFALVGLGGYYLSRPAFETLYAGLDREDVSRIGATLKAAGISFDINPEGNAVSVHYGQTAQARMLLAERGLPQSANSGYELFDKVGALGLTSFMQEVTRVRAMEGELARTIQLIRGVKAARVHIVMQDEGSFRRAKQPPSASVVIRTEGPDDSSAAQAIRHLLAAAVPGMSVDQVTVLNTDGMVLTSSDGDQTDAIPAKTLSLEKNISKDIQDNIRRTLTPYLRLPNFQVSVRTRINTDRKQISETVFDPDSRVERSVRTVKESSNSQNRSAANAGNAAGVDRNIPQERAPTPDGKQSNDENKKTEELTNFELSSKSVTTVSGGYTIENLSIAVLVNRASFNDPNKETVKPEAVDRQLREIEQLVTSAAGLKKDRGDTLKVTAVDFMFNEHELNPVESAGWNEVLAHHLGSLINAATILVVTTLIVLFGLRPAGRALLAEAPVVRIEPPQLQGPDQSVALASPPPPQNALPSSLGQDDIEAFAPRSKNPEQRKLERLIEFDEARAASILKQWMQGEGRT